MSEIDVEKVYEAYIEGAMLTEREIEALKAAIGGFDDKKEEALLDQAAATNVTENA